MSKVPVGLRRGDGYLLEGAPTIAWVVLTFFVLPARQEVVAAIGTRLFSSGGERRLILERILASKLL